MSETVFARIISGKLPCAKVYEDGLTFAFMDAGQVNPGHVIVASRKPYITLMEADAHTAAALMTAAWRIARAVEKAFHAPGITVLQANHAAGWQTVPHLHLHVLARHPDDGVQLVWPRKNPNLEALKELASRIHIED
jgi:histidine triad (HIT) family protein